MGEIWLARAQGVAGWEKQVVIKTILPHLSDQSEFVDRFLDEAHIATTLTHGNIVPVFELGEDNGTYFIAMEYVDGWDLRTILRRVRVQEDPFPETIALYIAAEVCRGLDYAHNRKDEAGKPRAIVHRDISPANLLVSRDGEVRIVDFGIASARSRLNQTLTGELRGKFAYMSPEQALGQQVDGRSDLFSLGVVLYEMLAGIRPFEGDSDLEILGRVQRADYKPLRELRPDLDPTTYKLVDKALALAPAERFADAAAMNLALLNQLYQETGPVAARQLADFCLRFDRPTYSTGDISAQSFDALLNQQLAEMSGERGTPTPSFSTPSGTHSHTTQVPTNPFVVASTTGHDRTQTVRIAPRVDHRKRRILIAIGVVLALITLVSVLAFRLGSRTASNGPVVRVETDPPGALIYFNGVSYGRSTLVTRVPQGEWLLRAELDGYDVVEQIIVYDGKVDLNLDLPLQARPTVAASQSVSITSLPPGARFRIDDGPWLDDGETAVVPLGTPVTITYELDGFEPLSVTHTFGAGEQQFARRLTALVVEEAPSPTTTDETSDRRSATVRIRLTGVPASARVFVNGERQSSAENLKLHSDRASVIRVEAAGFAPTEQRFDPRTTASRDLDIRLEALAQGTVTVRFIGSVLIGEVLVDGRSYGVNERAPRMQLQLPTGPHVIVVRNTEHGLAFEQTVDVRDAEDIMVRVDW